MVAKLESNAASGARISLSGLKSFERDFNMFLLLGCKYRTKYEYDPFGNPTAEHGELAAANPFRFSTKYWDSDTKTLAYQFRDYGPGMGRWLSRDPLERVIATNPFLFCRNDAIRYIDPFGLLERDELFNWSDSKKLEWMHAFREKFKAAIRKSSKANCVPRKLIAVIVANELAEWRWPDGTFLDGAGGGGVGPAQIAVETAINEGVTGFEGKGILNEALLLDAVDAKLRTVEGSIDIAGRLIRKYLDELCDRAKNGNYGTGMLTSDIYGDCNVNSLCCSGILQDCAKMQEYAPSRCIIRMMAAVWNSNRAVLDARDPISDETGKRNFPNALNNALWAEEFSNYMSDLVD